MLLVSWIVHVSPDERVKVFGSQYAREILLICDASDRGGNDAETSRI